VSACAADTGALTYLPLRRAQRAQVKTLVRGELDFWTALHRELAKHEQGNLALSPIGISLAFGMVHAGARGATAQQIESVLRYPKTDVHSIHKALLRSLADPDRGYTLRIANRVFVDKQSGLLPNYSDFVRTHYGAPARALNIAFATEKSREEINRWVNQRTFGRVPEAMPAGGMSADTAVVLVNAIAVNARWKYKFEKYKTRNETFYTTRQDSVLVPMMRREAIFRAVSHDNVEVLELPYRGGGLVMRIVVPRDPEGMLKFEREMSARKILNLFSTLGQPRKIKVELPRFKVKPQPLLLDQSLQSLGMAAPFAQSDFSAMTSTRAAIGNAFHAVAIDVDEQGTKAATSTSNSIVKSIDLSLDFVSVDRPFFFFIQETQTNAVLIAGRIMDPRG